MRHMRGVALISVIAGIAAVVFAGLPAAAGGQGGLAALIPQWSHGIGLWPRGGDLAPGEFMLVVGLGDGLARWLVIGGIALAGAIVTGRIRRGQTETQAVVDAGRPARPGDPVTGVGE